MNKTTCAFTAGSSAKICSHRERVTPEKALTPHSYRVAYPKVNYGIYGLAHRIAYSLLEREPTLLWITEWGIWPSSENLHLYYRLRRSYGNSDLLEEAPGHLFLGFETEDLASFLQLSMLNGWGGYVLTHANYVNAFFSHDECVDFTASHEQNLDELKNEFAR